MAGSSAIARKVNYIPADQRHADVSGTQALLDHIDHALQPIVDIHTGRIFGYEALLTGYQVSGCGSPRDFIAEAGAKVGIAELEKALLERAVAKFISLSNAKDHVLFFNISEQALAENRFPFNDALEILTKNGLEPRNLSLELPEECHALSNEQVTEFVQKAIAAGLEFAVDDFGQGYAQLKVLYDFQPTVLKIDRFFISLIQSDSRKRLLVNTVVDLAHLLGMRVVAEGVETAAEYAICRQIGCDLIQGYFIAQPTTDVSELLPSYNLPSGAVRKRSDERLDVIAIFDQIEQPEPVKRNATIQQALDIFGKNNGLHILPVVNDSDQPIGLLFDRDIIEYLYSPFGRDLIRNPAMQIDISDKVQPCPIADINLRPEQLVELNNGDNITHGIILTDEGRYFGFMPVNALLRLANHVRLREAEDRNPLSKLPGNGAITDFITASVSNTEVDRYLCYIDFDNFKPFNDRFGFRTGDRAILMFSDLLRKHVKRPNTVLGHVGGDDFFVGVTNATKKNVLKMAEFIRSEFTKQAESLYDPEHRDAGCIICKDRHGEMREFSLLSCSISVVHLPAGQGPIDEAKVMREIAETKSDAKKDPAGIVLKTIL